MTFLSLFARTKNANSVPAVVLGLLLSACGAKGMALGSDGSEVKGDAADTEPAQGDTDTDGEGMPAAVDPEPESAVTGEAEPTSGDEGEPMVAGEAQGEPMVAEPMLAEPMVDEPMVAEPMLATDEPEPVPVPSGLPETMPSQPRGIGGAPNLPSMNPPSEMNDEPSTSNGPSMNPVPVMVPGIPPASGTPGPSSTMTAPNSMTYCGDGVVDEGEECDLGLGNGVPAPPNLRCSSECSLAPFDAGVPVDSGVE
jgi:hypothetical protein